MANEELLSAPKVAVILGVSDETVRRWAENGRLPFVTLPSGRKVYRRSDVDAILEPTEAAS